jgi:hypothetical protein
MYYSSSDKLDSVLESMFNNHASSGSGDLSLMAALESFDNFAINTLGSNYSYASEGVGSAIKNAVKKAVGFIKKFFRDLAAKIKRFWEGLFNKHKALQNKIEDGEKAVEKSIKHIEHLYDAEKMAATYSHKFNEEAVTNYCTKAKEAANAVKSSCETIKGVLTSLVGGDTGDNVTVPKTESVTKVIEKSTQALEKCEEELTKKKEEFEKKILDTLEEKFKDISAKELQALVTLTKGKLKDVSDVRAIAKEIDDIIKDNEDLADKIDSKLTAPDDDADASEKNKYEKLKAGVDLWKEVAKEFQDFTKTVCKGVDSVISGFGNKFSYYQPLAGKDGEDKEYQRYRTINISNDYD